MARSTTRGLIRLLAVLAFLALALSACNGGTATTDDAPAEAPAATDDTTDEAPAEDATDDTTDEGPVDADAEEDAEDAAAAEPATPPPAKPVVTKPAPAKPAPAEPAATPTPAAPQSEDGTHPSDIVTAASGSVTVDRIEVLTGAAAAAARAEDGQPEVEPGLDVPYLRNRNPMLRALPVAPDVSVRVYDCSAGCKLVPGSYADLVAGKPLPYGSPDAPFDITVRGGRVVEIAEVYLP